MGLPVTLATLIPGPNAAFILLADSSCCEGTGRGYQQMDEATLRHSSLPRISALVLPLSWAIRWRPTAVVDDLGAYQDSHSDAAFA